MVIEIADSLVSCFFTLQQTGQISDMILMDDFLERFAQTKSDGTHEFSTIRSGLIVSMLSIGTLFGALTGQYVSDSLGRRKAICVFSIVFMVGLIIQGECRQEKPHFLF